MSDHDPVYYEYDIKKKKFKERTFFNMRTKNEKLGSHSILIFSKLLQSKKDKLYGSKTKDNTRQAAL